MLEELKSIDSSVIEELMEIKRERETIAERLAKMEAEKEQVSDVVYRRVKRDYQSKSTGLERKAAPLKDRAKAEYVKLKSLIDRLESQHQSTRLDREEVDFRNRLGEFEKKQFEARVEELDRTLSEQEADLAEAAEVRDRFVEAFDSEEELASGAPTPAPPEPEPEAEEPAADEAKG
ncbi:MAG TPA: hypothetical protein VLA66_05405, partial [Thermoanaerobaculia bacterium]|nr:hypothetical protein [Thermoanaerobaculia bacterium]